MGFLRDFYSSAAPMYVAFFAMLAMVQLRGAKTDLSRWQRQVWQDFQRREREAWLRQQRAQLPPEGGQPSPPARRKE